MKLSEVPTRIAVASGKGGVGKTTVSSDIARTLDEMGYTVGLIDADISTPNTPEVVGSEDQDLSDQRLSTSEALLAPKINGIQVISQGHVLPDDVPILGGGGFRAQAVADYIEGVEWDDDTDVVVIDTPPGVGEEIQTLTAAVTIDHAFVVSTPHPSSVRDVTKTHEFFKEPGVEHTAILNMAYVPSDDIAEHVLSRPDFTNIQQIGEDRADEIRHLIETTTDDLALFGYDTDTRDAIPVEVDAVVPYTDDYERRSSRYKQALRREVEGMEADS